MLFFLQAVTGQLKPALLSAGISVESGICLGDWRVFRAKAQLGLGQTNKASMHSK